jgi:multiple sugar transport system substrate-binding protein
MKQFGYSIPTTWEQYEALGLRVAKEHPGCIIGEFGDIFSLYVYFWGSHCPVHELVGQDKLRIDLFDPVVHAGIPCLRTIDELR